MTVTQRFLTWTTRFIVGTSYGTWIAVAATTAIPMLSEVTTPPLGGYDLATDLVDGLFTSILPMAALWCVAVAAIRILSLTHDIRDPLSLRHCRRMTRCLYALGMCWSVLVVSIPCTFFFRAPVFSHAASMAATGLVLSPIMFVAVSMLSLDRLIWGCFPPALLDEPLRPSTAAVEVSTFD